VDENKRFAVIFEHTETGWGDRAAQPQDSRVRVGAAADLSSK
jgi:hypothetical protein